MTATYYTKHDGLFCCYFALTSPICLLPSPVVFYYMPRQQRLWGSRCLFKQMSTGPCTITALQPPQLSVCEGDMTVAAGPRSIVTSTCRHHKNFACPKAVKTSAKCCLKLLQRAFVRIGIPRKYPWNVGHISRQSHHPQVCLRILHKHHQRHQAAKQDCSTVRRWEVVSLAWPKGSHAWATWWPSTMKWLAC